MVVHFAAVLFVGFITYTAWPGSSLFSWHPTLMAIAFALSMLEAIMVFSPESSLLRNATRQTKVRVHQVGQILAITCASLGFAAIWYSKQMSGKAHFQSWHGLIGIITLGYVCVQAMGGSFSMYFPHIAKKMAPPAKMKMYHATSGLIAFSLVCASLVLGTCTTWFSNNAGVTCWYACLAAIAFMVLAVMNQVTTAYLPKQQKKVAKKAT